MSCPNCYCVECAKERARWSPPTVPFQPYVNIPRAQPYINIPNEHPQPYVNIPRAHGWWQCSCGARHPPSYFCTQISGVGVSFNPKPYLNPNS
jgi:hypothetical protein